MVASITRIYMSVIICNTVCNELKDAGTGLVLRNEDLKKVMILCGTRLQWSMLRMQGDIVTARPEHTVLCVRSSNTVHSEVEEWRLLGCCAVWLL
jgi:hypothetical protein